MEDFTKLNLKNDIISALNSLKIKKPTEVQEKIIPLVQQGRNVVFTSRTGSGKTLAYSLGFLSKINKKLGIQMLVLVPTRELAIQVGKELTKICDILELKVGTLYGGRDMTGDSRTLGKKINILVGTPGRIIEHINDKNIKVGDVKHLIYDESDQMFDDGFQSACTYVKKRVSKNVQIILSSATITEKVEDFCEYQIRDYDYLEIGDLIPKDIIQEKMNCEIANKNEVVLKYIKSNKFKRILIFCNKKDRTREIAYFLNDNKVKAKFLNGNMEQKDRENVLNLFKQGKLNIIVTTDVAARGLHIENVGLVLNYDAPTRLEFYVHRIGRTGRNGNKGHALNLICSEDEERFKEIEEEFDLSVSEINLSS